jgi:hypothetical protein
LPQRPRQRSRQKRFVVEALKVHARRSRDLIYALAAEWRAGNGKTAARNQAFRPSFQQAQILTCHVHVILANVSVLRNRCDELAAKRGHHNQPAGAHDQPPGAHAAASGFFRGDRMASSMFAGVPAATKLRKIFRRAAAPR